MIINGIEYLTIFLIISLSYSLSFLSLGGNILLFFILILKYIYPNNPPKKAPEEAIPIAYFKSNLNTLYIK